MRTTVVIFGVMIFLTMSSVTAHGFTLTQRGLKGFQAETLKISLNPANCPASVESELDFAIELWNNTPGSRLRLEKDAQNSVAVSSWSNFSFPQTIMVGCSANFNADSGGAGASTIGVGTSNTLGGDSLQKGYLLLNEQGGSGQYSAQSAAVRKFTMAHELGHVFGLGHSSVYEALMFASVSDKDDVTLHQDDIDGIAYLYPIDEMARNMFYGCGAGTIAPGTPGGSNSQSASPWATVLVLIPFVLAFYLKRRSSSLAHL